MRLARLELSRLPLTATALILSLAVAPVLLAQVPTPPINFVGTEPCRIADTRGNGFTGQYGPPALSQGVPRNFTLTGQCGIPAIAKAVSLNVTVTNTQGPGFILIHPQGGSQPVVSTLNYVANQTVANAALVPLGSGITVIAGVSGTDLILDTNGYFTDTDLDFKGAWASGTTYGLNDVVTFGGSIWVSLTSGNTGNQPDTSPTRWALLTGSSLPAANAFEVVGNLLLPDSTATTGNIFKGGTRFLHDFGITNTFLGKNAGNLVMTGQGNTAVGEDALSANTSGVLNTAVGTFALRFNTTGAANTAVGQNALQNNTTAANNTAVGQNTLVANTSGGANTAVGQAALNSNTTAPFNTAVGRGALQNNTTAPSNTAVGADALNSNTTGNSNTAVGQGALDFNTTGNRNTALGQGALVSSTGSENVAIGKDAGFNLLTGSNNIYIANAGAFNESTAIRIGNIHTAAFMAGIYGRTVAADNVTVSVDSSGKLGTTLSSRRFKEEIRDMGEASRGLLKLRPITFRYKPEHDGSDLLQYGLIAEEVAEVYPELVAHSESGEPMAVRYHVLPAMLLNELQRQELEIQALRRRIDRLEAEQAQRIEDLASRLARFETRATSSAEDDR